MDTNEKNVSTAEKQPGSPEGREGKRPQNHNHHHYGRTRYQNRPKPAEGKEAAATEMTPSASSHTEGSHPAGQKKQNRNQPRGRQEDRKESRENRENRDIRENRKDAAPVQEAPGKRSAPATGRPQRAARHAASPELPDMDNLLIDDGMQAAEKQFRLGEDIDPDEIERILAHDPFAHVKSELPEVIPEGKVVIVGIRFRAGGKTYFFDPGEIICAIGQYAIVETARGLEFGEVCMGNRLLDESMVVPPLRPVVRLATEEDIAHNRENHAREDEAFRIGVQKINEHKLDMKLVAVQYTFDNAKLLFYFTSAKRVDFRELVKDLAGIFHLRIELRQIGIRDEARMIGGLGPCGRPLCCTTFLSDFGQVSMKMAKEQNLSLNSAKISGCCGRLMCCLRYEHETYLEEIKRTPAVGSFVNTPDGPGVVTDVHLLKGEVKVSLRNQPDSAPKKFSRDEVELQVRDRRPVSSAETASAEPIVEEEPDSEE